MATFSISLLAAGGDDDRRNRIINVIEEELREVTRLSGQRNNSDPELLLRVAELHLEKARLIRESENEKFLEVPVEKRRTINEAQYFSNSTRSFQAANQYASAVTKKFPRYREIADVYYILAYNSRELKNYKQSEYYFDLARKRAPKNSMTSFKAQLALADSYYNKAYYSKAIPLYESSLSKLNETWWTKDAFNLAWCYYRVRNYSKAISLMQDIHKRSSDQRYINMKYFVERDLVIFYVDAKRSQEAIAWYKSQGIDYSNQLIKIVKVLTAQGKFTQAEQLINEAAKIQRTSEGRIEVLSLQLELFDKFQKIPNHLNAATELTGFSEKKMLSDGQKKVLEYQVAKKAAEMQKAASSNVYKNVKKTRLLRANQANSYFALMIRLNPAKSAEPLFFQGETSYSAGLYSQAMDYYLNAHTAANKESNSKISSQAMEGMLASLGQKGFPAKQAEQYYIPVYTKFLESDPKSTRAKIIRQKLFKVYMDRKDIPNAEKVMAEYASLYPQDFKTQEAMLAGIMDDARAKKDFLRFKSFVVQINEGKYKVSVKYANALRQMMTKIQIEDAQAALDKGDKANALRSYIRIYNGVDSTPRAKANAAYNLAALYYEASDLTESYKWAAMAIQEMTAPEVKKFVDSFLTIGTNLFLRQRYQQSADLGTRTLGKLCKQGVSAKNTAFKNAAFLWLSEKNLEKAEEVLNLGIQCGIDQQNLNEVRIELAKEYQALKRWDSLQQVILPVASSKSQAPQAIVFLNALKESYQGVGDSANANLLNNKIQSIYRDAKSKNLSIPVEALDLIAYGMMPKLLQKQAQLNTMTLSFPEESFNNTVKRKLVLLDSLTADVNDIQKTGSGRGMVKAYKILINCYENFATELSQFTPEGKSADYVTSFKKAMAGVWTPILQTAQKRRGEVRNLINKNNILSEDNPEMLGAQNSSFVPQYQFVQNMVLMDRGGAR